MEKKPEDPAQVSHAVWLITKSLFFIAVSYMSLILVVGTSVVMGLLTFTLLDYLNQAVPLFVGVVSFFSGMAGRDWMKFQLWDLLFPGTRGTQ